MRIMVDNIQEKLHQLLIKYTQNLPDKMLRIAAQWHALQHCWNNAAWQALHREVHSLCGSAGTYGYKDISQRARQLETYLKAELDAKSITQINQERMSELLEHLQASVVLARHQNPDQQQNALMEGKPAENSGIYVLKQDKKLERSLVESLAHAGYQARGLPDLLSLEKAVREKEPLAIILDTEYLAGDGMACIQRIQKQQAVPSLLFCVVPNADLMPRLQAIRAGCQAFFQKPVDVFHLTQTLNQKLNMSAQEAWRILIVDDSESLAEYYSLILNQAGMITHAITDPLQLLHELPLFQPHLILMDIYMPACTGLELASVLRHERRYMKIPIIFLSTEDDRRKQLSAMSLGGDDFLTKPVLPQHLVSAVLSRSKRAGMLDYFMTTDSLTGLLNHSSVLDRLDMEVLHARQKNMPLSFIMIDIDHFKKINDTYGHPVGDVVLKKLSTLLSVRLRAQDIIGRYGGEEFVIILPGANAEHSMRICNELRQQFSEYDFHADGKHFSVTFSAGFVCLRKDNNACTLVVEADQMLYKAKLAGRNQVHGLEYHSGPEWKKTHLVQPYS